MHSSWRKFRGELGLHFYKWCIVQPFLIAAPEGALWAVAVGLLLLNVPLKFVQRFGLCIPGPSIFWKNNILTSYESGHAIDSQSS